MKKSANERFSLRRTTITQSGPPPVGMPAESIKAKPNNPSTPNSRKRLINCSTYSKYQQHILTRDKSRPIYKVVRIF